MFLFEISIIIGLVIFVNALIERQAKSAWKENEGFLQLVPVRFRRPEWLKTIHHGR